MYNLTPAQKDLLKFVVKEVKDGNLDEEFYIVWLLNGECMVWCEGAKDSRSYSGITRGAIDALAAEHLIRCDVEYKTEISEFGGRTSHQQRENSRLITITAKGYEAVATDFGAPDTSFIRHITPLSDVASLDGELNFRCVAMLGAGSTDPRIWDSAVRTAGVVLEERMRAVGQISDRHRVGLDLVNDVFGNNGSLSGRFATSAERQGYRDLYAGAVGAFRNRFAHRLVDPSPQDGGSYIMFINLLLKMLEDLRPQQASEPKP